MATGGSKRTAPAVCPRGKLHPYSVDLLDELGYPTDELRYKSWDEFAGDDAPELDFVFTVCDSATGEVCPVWPGRPMAAHCGIPDPSSVEGSDAERLRAFIEAHQSMAAQIEEFIELPFETLKTSSLQQRLARTGKGADV